ncbi:MAG: hypothetical protein NVSMB57_15250 [Actinomycetota bacterium]
MKRKQREKRKGRARTWILLYVLLAGGGIAIMVGIGCTINANACPFTSEAKQTTTNGMTLYLTNCAACHGRKGEGVSGPSLTAGSGALLKGDALVTKISRGKPLAGMPKFARSLSAQQIQAVAAFVETLRSSSEPATSP